ncbi:homoserine kinase [Robiginitalea sp. IMCC43444]|uniref:homoserine kinase n=1 Tax=Robiginitalea sp. IMCC43444 TaxID=3459121 RepID=UPI0040429EAB
MENPAQKSISIFSPATIANLSCGFDVLGLALDGVGDKMKIGLCADPGLRITRITGCDLPMDTDKNVAGIAALALLDESTYRGGVEIEIHKQIKPGSGIGSSAASAAGAVWGLNKLLGNPFEATELVRFAMQGEKLASGAAHADNVAPAIFGGITLVRCSDPLDIVSIPCPSEMFACVLHPQIEIKTSDSRGLLKTTIPLSKGIRQWGNVGGLVAGFFKSDYGLISRSLEDCIIEPTRSLLIPGFAELKTAAMQSGALGFGISGSGPSMFALCRGKQQARKTARAMEASFTTKSIPFEMHISRINSDGIREIEHDGKQES